MTLRPLFLLLLTAASSLAADVQWFKDVDYVGDNDPRHKLDIAIPPHDDAQKKLPLVVFIHGGSWSAGSKKDGLPIVNGLVASGYVAATIGYRLTDQAIWPAQIFDCKAAIRFLRAKAADYQVDPDRIGVAGMSAGGQLVSLLGTSGGVKEVEGDLGQHLDTSSKVSCVVNFFGPENFLNIISQNTEYPLFAKADQKTFVKFFGGTLEQEEVRKKAIEASPVTWISKDDPPVLTAHGTKDPIVPYAQATEFHAALQKAGVETHLVTMEGKGHGFYSDDLNRRIMQFLDKHLKNIPADIPLEVTLKK